MIFPFWREYYLPLKPKQDVLRRKRPLSSVHFSRMCVFLLSRFSLVAVNKAFYCGVVSAIADTVSVQGVPVPGPNPQTNSKEGQGQPLPLLSLGIKAEELYLTLNLYSSSLLVGQFILLLEMKNKNFFLQQRFSVITAIFKTLLIGFLIKWKHNIKTWDGGQRDRNEKAGGEWERGSCFKHQHWYYNVMYLEIMIKLFITVSILTVRASS